MVQLRCLELPAVWGLQGKTGRAGDFEGRLLRVKTESELLCYPKCLSGFCPLSLMVEPPSLAT